MIRRDVVGKGRGGTVDPPIYSTSHTVAQLPLPSSQVRWERVVERSKGEGGGRARKSTEHRNDRPQGTCGHRAYQAEDGKGRTENRQQTTDTRRMQRRADRHTDVGCHVGAIK